MNYYKLTRGGSVFAAATSGDLRRYQAKHNILVSSSPEEAECLQLSDGSLYRDRWMHRLKTSYFQPETVTIHGISEEEYRVLAEALFKGEELIAAEAEIAPPPSEPEEPPEAFLAEDTIEYVRETKLKELSLACSKAITAGFDFVLPSGEKQHYSLTMQDQANLSAAQFQILSGESEIPYHADGEEHRLYTVDEITAVIRAANDHKALQLATLGCLKSWVAALRRVSSIRAVEYGSKIPEKYRSPLLAQLQGDR